MKKLKDIVKQDFTNKLDANLSFDTSSLKVSERKVDKKKIIKRVSIAVACCVIISIIAVPTAFFLDLAITTKNSFKTVQKSYTKNELLVMEENSYKKLNNITYPSTNIKEEKVEEQYVNSVNNFAYEIYKNTNKEENFSFAPLNLHANLSIASEAINDQTILANVDNVLGLTSSSRRQNYKIAYENNFVVTDRGTTQMYNGVFATNKYQTNPQFINNLSSYYVEAYSLDFNNNQDVNKMLGWLDSTVNEKGYMDVKDLQINEETAMYIFSTLYFNTDWLTRFDTINNKEDVFYLSNNQQINVTYMYHEYMGDIYEYDKYVSCYDRYANGYKIQYVVPKSLDDNIYDLLNDVNFLNEDESKKIVCEETYGNGETYKYNPIIELSLPKFNTTSKINFNETLKNIGLSNLFDKSLKAFNNAFENLDENTSIYLDFVKQKNSVSFTETGTTIKSISFSGFGATSAGPDEDRNIYQVDLNQPFVYVVYDSLDIPIYLGCVDNPSK